MSAIEMMDPKMDAGMIGNQVNRKVLNFEQAIKVVTIVPFVFSLIICYSYVKTFWLIMEIKLSISN